MTPNKLSKPNNQPPWGRYAGLGTQMMAIIGGFVWLGTWLDTRYPTHNPLWTAGLALLGCVFAILYAVRDYIRKP